MRAIPAVPDHRYRATRLAVVLATLLALPALARSAGAAGSPPRLEVHSRVLGERECAAWFEAALRAPRDSAALRSGLGRAVQELEARGHLEARASASWDTL
ncbi:MAG: hypothetical protein ACRENS_12495, partial [Candidatus Eiseniibacteriota bacterium]